jgi:glycerophosphoryl diester phosphodiesterase
MKNVSFILIIISFIGCAHHKKDKLVIAHRGASAYLPEHSLAAYAYAYALGVDFIEPDLVMTKDNKIIIMHDPHIDTTTNVKEVFPRRKRSDGRYYAIDFTLKELKRLHLNERVDSSGKSIFPTRFPQKKSSFLIPTLSEFIELIQGLNKSTGRNVGIIPELKTPEFHLKEGKDIAKVVLAELNRYGYQDGKSIYLQCFYPPTLKRIKNEFKSKIPLVQLLADNSWKETSTDYDYYLSAKGVNEISQYAEVLSPWYPQLEKYQLSKLAKKHKLKLIPYTHRPEQIPVAMSEEMFLDELFIEHSIDGLFSDAPDRVLKYLNR